MWLETLNADLMQSLGPEPIATAQRAQVEHAQSQLLRALLQGLHLKESAHNLVIWRSLSAADYALIVERSLYNALCVCDQSPLSLLPRAAYAQRVRELVSNLKRNAPRLIQYDPRYLASASFDELGQGLPAAAERAAALEARRQAVVAIAEHRKRLLESDFQGAYRCRFCKSWKTEYYLLQTRSADEPMTAFITCLICGRRQKS